MEAEFVTPSWDIITAGHWNGRWDVSVGSMTPTGARAQVLDFPANYYYVPAAFAVHNDSAATTLADLEGKKIGVSGGCTYDAYLQKNLWNDAEGVPAFECQVTAGEIRTYDTDTSAYDDLRIGDGKRLDAVMSAMPTILEAQKNNYPMKIIGDPAFSMIVAFGLPWCSRCRSCCSWRSTCVARSLATCCVRPSASQPSPASGDVSPPRWC